MRRIPSRGLVIAVLVLALVVAAGAFVYSRLPDPDKLQQKPARPSILITDRDGRVLYEAIDPAGNKHVPLPLSSIPAMCRSATIATEDANFYSHPGVDPIAIARAVWLNLRAGKTVSGGEHAHAATGPQPAHDGGGAQRAHAGPEDTGGVAGIAARAEVLEGRAARPLPQHDVLRPLRDGHRSCQPGLLRHPRGRTGPRASARCWPVCRNGPQATTRSRTWTRRGGARRPCCD